MLPGCGQSIVYTNHHTILLPRSTQRVYRIVDLIVFLGPDFVMLASLKQIIVRLINVLPVGAGCPGQILVET